MTRATIIGLLMGETWPVGLLTFAVVENRKALTRWTRARKVVPINPRRDRMRYESPPVDRPG